MRRVLIKKCEFKKYICKSEVGFGVVVGIHKYMSKQIKFHMLDKPRDKQRVCSTSTAKFTQIQKNTCKRFHPLNLLWNDQ